MTRIDSFTSIFGEDWVVGRYLLPQLVILGGEQRGVLLDLACGESPFRAYFPEVSKYVRIDRNALDADVSVGDMLAIPLKSQSVDVVLLFQAITDVRNPTEVLKEIRRVLKPGGQLLVFESMAYPEHDPPNDFYRLMPEGLRTLGAEAGLNLMECTRLGGLFTRFASLWTVFVMGRMKEHLILRPLAHFGVASANLFCYALDCLAPHPRLASDYLAVLTSSVEPFDAASLRSESRN